MRTRLLIVLLLPMGVTLCQAAPAPFPKPENGAEAVLDARTPERARAIASYLRSHLFADNWESGQPLALPLRGSAERRAWFSANLRVTTEGTRLRLRVADVPGGEAALTALSAHLSRQTPMSGEDKERQQMIRMLMRVMKQQQRGSGDDPDAEARSGQHAIEDEPLRVQTSPTRLRRGR